MSILSAPITNSEFTPPDTTQLDRRVVSCLAVWIDYNTPITPMADLFRTGVSVHFLYWRWLIVNCYVEMLHNSTRISQKHQQHRLWPREGYVHKIHKISVAGVRGTQWLWPSGKFDWHLKKLAAEFWVLRFVTCTTGWRPLMGSLHAALHISLAWFQGATRRRGVWEERTREEKRGWE